MRTPGGPSAPSPTPRRSPGGAQSSPVAADRQRQPTVPLLCERPGMSDFEIQVRPARADDTPALVQLFAQLGYSTDEATIRAQLEQFGQGGAHALVAELVSHRLAGLATVAVHPRLYSRAP